MQQVMQVSSKNESGKGRKKERKRERKKEICSESCGAKISCTSIHTNLMTIHQVFLINETRNYIANAFGLVLWLGITNSNKGGLA